MQLFPCGCLATPLKASPLDTIPEEESSMLPPLKSVEYLPKIRSATYGRFSKKGSYAEVYCTLP